MKKNRGLTTLGTIGTTGGMVAASAVLVINLLLPRIDKVVDDRVKDGNDITALAAAVATLPDMKAQLIQQHDDIIILKTTTGTTNDIIKRIGEASYGISGDAVEARVKRDVISSSKIASTTP